MEIYNKEKHHDLVLEHIYSAYISGYELQKYFLTDNYGNLLVQLAINKTATIMLKGQEYKQLLEEVRECNIPFRVPQGQTSLNYQKKKLNLGMNK